MKAAISRPLTAAMMGWLIGAASAFAQPPAVNPSPAPMPVPPPATQPGAGAGSAAQPAPPPSWQQGMPEGEEALKLAPQVPPPFATPVDKLPVAKLKLPKNFNLEVYAAGLTNARSLRIGDRGTVFVSTRVLDRIYAIIDKNGKREVKTLLTGLYRPNGIALHNGTLYIAELSKISKIDQIENQLDNPPARLSSTTICRRTSRTAGNTSPSVPTRSCTSRLAPPATSACRRSGTPRSTVSVSMVRASKSTPTASAKSSAWIGIRP